MLPVEVSSLRILAFHFADGAAAETAVRELRDSFDREAQDVETAPVVVEGVEGVVVGLTAAESARAELIPVLTSRGGRLVADVAEEWTTPRGR
jgi:uncharacterized protein (DUF697 family)